MGLREFELALRNMLKASDLTWEESEALLGTFAGVHGELERLIVNSGMFRSSEINRMMGSLEAMMAEYGGQLLRISSNGQFRAWTRGVDAFDSMMLSMEINYSKGLTGLEDHLVQQYLTINRIAGVTEEMKALIRSEVLGGIYLEKSPFEVMAAITNLLGIRDLPGFREIGTTGISAKAERIMRTETMSIFNSAKWWNEQETAARFPDLQHIWLATGDFRTRLEHLMAHGQTQPVSVPFSVGGEQARFPGDPTLSPWNRINCVVDDTVVWCLDEPLAVTKRKYTGPLIVFETINGRNLTATPNHPVLTPFGWMLAKELHEFDQVVCCEGQQNLFMTKPDINWYPVKIDELFDAQTDTGHTERMPGLAVNFHGERPNSEVDVVWTNRLLPDRDYASLHKEIGQLYFPTAEFVECSLGSSGAFGQHLETVLHLTPFFLGGLGQGGTFSRGKFFHTDIHTFRTTSGWNSRVAKNPSYGCTGEKEFKGQLLDAATNLKSFDKFLLDLGRYNQFVIMPSFNPGLIQDPINRFFVQTKGHSQNARAFPLSVSLDKIAKTRIIKNNLGRHVYNLSTNTGWYVANGIITHNCRCTTAPYRTDWGVVTDLIGPLDEQIDREKKAREKQEGN